MTSKAMQFKSFKLDTFDDDAGTVEGYASTFGDIDKANDVVEPGAFKTAVLHGPDRVRFLWNHQAGEVIGMVKELYEDERGLFIKAQFAATQRAQETRELMKMGAVDSFSIGYRVLQEKSDRLADGRRVNRLKNIHLLEVSCVPWPCNVEARLTAVKSELSSRFDGLSLDHQALIGKFIDYLDGEEKSEVVEVEQTLDLIETKDAPEQPSEDQEALSGILSALELHQVHVALRGSL